MTGYFSPGCYFATLERATFEIFTSFEIISLMKHERRPRIENMKCLAQKLTQNRRIEKLWQKHGIDIFLKIERFALCRCCYQLSTKWLSRSQGWSDFDETGLYGFLIGNGEKSGRVNSPNSVEFEELWNF